jgi:hypothetical protein
MNSTKINDGVCMNPCNRVEGQLCLLHVGLKISLENTSIVSASKNYAKEIRLFTNELYWYKFRLS